MEEGVVGVLVVRDPLVMMFARGEEKVDVLAVGGGEQGMGHVRDENDFVPVPCEVFVVPGIAKEHSCQEGAPVDGLEGGEGWHGMAWPRASHSGDRSRGEQGRGAGC